MKFIYKLNSRMTVELESEDQKELFSKLASVQEIFSEEKCGLCQSTNLRFVTREVDGNKYYELRCADCGAILSFGQHKKGGTLFPKRKDDEGNYLPNKGWHKWEPSKDDSNNKAPVKKK